jgi:acyl-homoserine lactone acylase PvdQ
MTTGGPDTADVYELTLKEDDPTQYLYDGEWRQMTSREVTLEVKDAEPMTVTIWDCHYGPVAGMKDGKAYAVKMAYADAVQVHEAWYEFNFAKDYQGVMAGLATLQVFPQNVMVADTSGNIYYQRTGRVPKRPAGYDWSKPVDGSTSATEWQGFHPASDHVQILNPPQGYMQNCNIPPDVMMVDCPLTPDKYLPYIYGSSGGYSNQRGARAVELLAGDDSVTIEEALAYAVDVHPYGCERWIEVLKKAHEQCGDNLKGNEAYTAGIKDLLDWDQELRRDSTGALKYFYWREQLVREFGGDTMRELSRRIDARNLASVGKPAPPLDMSDQELEAAATSFASAMTRLKEDLGSLDAVYGDVFRVGRDDVSWPLGGGGGRNGTTTLRNIGYERRPREDHTRWGGSGQTSTQIVVMTKPVQSWTYLPVGQSDRPESPHYRDQAEKAFSPRKLKPTWWLAKDLVGHIESRTVLDQAK